VRILTGQRSLLWGMRKDPEEKQQKCNANSDQ